MARSYLPNQQGATILATSPGLPDAVLLRGRPEVDSRDASSSRCSRARRGSRSATCGRSRAFVVVPVALGPGGRTSTVGRPRLARPSWKQYSALAGPSASPCPPFRGCGTTAGTALIPPIIPSQEHEAGAISSAGGRRVDPQEWPAGRAGNTANGTPGSSTCSRSRGSASRSRARARLVWGDSMVDHRLRPVELRAVYNCLATARGTSAALLAVRSPRSSFGLRRVSSTERRYSAAVVGVVLTFPHFMQDSIAWPTSPTTLALVSAVASSRTCDVRLARVRSHHVTKRRNPSPQGGPRRRGHHASRGPRPRVRRRQNAGALVNDIAEGGVRRCDSRRLPSVGTGLQAVLPFTGVVLLAPRTLIPRRFRVTHRNSLSRSTNSRLFNVNPLFRT